jgi:hypothetical protein
MFEIFGSSALKAKMISEAWIPIRYWSDFDINKLTMEETFKLQEDSFELLQKTCGKHKIYSKLVYVCVTWLVVLNSSNGISNNPFSSKKLDLQIGLKGFLSERTRDLTLLPPPLLSLLNKYSNVLEEIEQKFPERPNVTNHPHEKMDESRETNASDSSVADHTLPVSGEWITEQWEFLQRKRARGKILDDYEIGLENQYKEYLKNNMARKGI